MIRAWNRHLAPAASETLLVRSWTRFCIEKYNISRSGYLPKCHQMLRLPRKVTLQLHQILRLPRKMNLMIDPRHIWNVIYNARNNHSHPPMSPNTAPAKQNASHDWSASHMKRHLECAEQAMSTSNLTKYCACHEICKVKISAETPWIASANRKTIRRQSDHDPRIKSSSRTRRFGDLTRPILETILYWKIQHLALRLSPKTSPNAAPATKSDNPTSPNTAPAKQNASHDWSASHMKRHLECAEQAMSTSNLTKYCACHEICKFKISAETPWIASANRKTIRRQSDHDPRIKSSSRTRRFGDLTRPILETILYWKIKHLALRLSPKMSPNAAPATKSDNPTSPNTAHAT